MASSVSRPALAPRRCRGAPTATAPSSSARRRPRGCSPSPRWRSQRLGRCAELVFRNLGAAGCQRRSTLARSAGSRVSYLPGGWDLYRYAGRFQGLLHDPGQVVADRVQVDGVFSRAANAATVWPASYRARLNRRSTAWCDLTGGSRGWNSTGRPSRSTPVGALVSPGPDHCLHGIPSGWSHDAPFAVRRPAHRPRRALASTSSGGAVISRPARRPAKTAHSTLTGRARAAHGNRR